MKRSVIVIVLLMTHIVLRGQTIDPEFQLDAEGDELYHNSLGVVADEWADADHRKGADESLYNNTNPTANIPQADQNIFLSPTTSTPDPFRSLSKFRFGAVRYRPRGLDSRHTRVVLGGVNLPEGIAARPDWEIVSLLRRGGIAQEHLGAMRNGLRGAGVGPTERFDPAASGKGMAVAVGAPGRYSRLRADLRQSHEWANGWSHRISVAGNGGADGYIRGVRRDALEGTAAVTKRWRGGSSLTLFGAGGYSERCLRTAATSEARNLTGDRFYNPAWGWQGGRVRNSRMARTAHIFAAALFETSLGPLGTLNISFAVRHNRSRTTRLAWYSGSSPLPDYYRVMPSWYPEWSAVRMIEQAWREGDPTVTQIDWAGLYRVNTLAPDGEATYIVEDLIEQARDFHFDASVTRRMGPGLELSYGLGLRRDGSRYFKEAADMLGAQWVPNIDRWVREGEDEGALGGLNDNDLRHPGRRVRRGERFGYDYRLAQWRPSVHGALRWSKTTLGFTAAAEITHTRLRRRGFYEKANFAARKSLGDSARAVFTTWSMNASGWWRPAVRHTVEIAALASSQAPFAENIFLSPQQNNLMIEGAVPSGLYGAEVSWSWMGGSIEGRVTGFVNATTGETQVRRYYDDLAGEFAQMVVKGVDRLGFGVEVGIEARLTRSLTLVAGASAGRYRYNSQPRATIYADATGEVISQGIECYMSGLAMATPQFVAAGEVVYSDQRGWRASVAVSWAGGRWVEVNPLYHSSRIAGINRAPEVMRQFTSQERLPDAFTLGATLAKGFVVRRGYLRVSARVDNILSPAIVYSGYEQMRIMRRGTGIGATFVPFPSKYLFSHPLTWSLTLSYRL